MSFFANTVRRFLARRGYAISRLEAGLPETLASYLSALPGRSLAVERGYIFDSDPEPLKEFLNVFEAERIVFSSGPNLAKLPSPLKENERIILEVDVAAFGAADTPAWLRRYVETASVVVIRSKLDHFWTGAGDLLDVSTRMTGFGLRLRDILQRVGTPLLRAPTENVFLVFERDTVPPVAGHQAQRDREYRVAEALNHLSVPLASKANLAWLTGRGSYGLVAGLYNPGAVQTEQGLILLARGERQPWPVQKRSRAEFVSSCQPMLLNVEHDFQVSRGVEVGLPDQPGPNPPRFEDFRLFSHQGRLYSNHSIIQPERDHDEREPIRPEKLHTAIGISHLDVEPSRLALIGTPVLDRPVTQMEKNWAMFSTGDRLHLVYSFNPYRLFSAAAFPGLHFSAAIERRLSLPLPDEGLPLRNSINPVSYDAGTFLHIVHKVYPGKQYVFWAVLIDKQTLTPTKMIPRPLLRAGASAAASIVYACSAISREDEILVFAGLDDCSIGAWRLARADLDRQWAPIA